MPKAQHSFFYPDGTVRVKPWYKKTSTWMEQTSTNTKDLTQMNTLSAMISAWYGNRSSAYLQELDDTSVDKVFVCNTRESGGIALRKILTVNPRVLNDGKERALLIDTLLSERDVEGKLYQKPVLPYILDLATDIVTALPFDFLCRLITMHYRTLETYESPSSNISLDPANYGMVSDWTDVHYQCPYLWVLLLLKQHVPDNIKI